MNRHEAREKAFQILFQLDINDNEPEQAIEEFLEKEERDEFLITLVKGVTKSIPEVDKIIADNLENWTLQRIASVEKSILRISTYEIRFLEEVPINVSINEAVELGNMYGDDKSGKFINGVLSKIIA
ncbi:N utilization substance protein B [Virgibacillus natechei]|uniref:Transcription antitermination protein NusB n=1 Tax=Virgibacillus natechei TaxID=1216297 RepID=A0ABS4IFI7_9BACI|nr:transcription antitermination factor NusB [Virgibacillus natechei]MBP1969709.1 N utilization substance protein B [Virgibacillus natechei]UZD11434.1 transcription antitermination factor NusB [Virgibacillus natechei]